jgi:hypothetical protein
MLAVPMQLFSVTPTAVWLGKKKKSEKVEVNEQYF